MKLKGILAIVGLSLILGFVVAELRAAKRVSKIQTSFDSVQVVMEQQNTDFDRELSYFLAENAALAARADSLDGELATQTAESDSAVIRLDSILVAPNVEMDSTVMEAIKAAVGSLQRTLVTCNDNLATCKTQVAKLSDQVRRDTTLIDQARSANRVLANQVQDLLRHPTSPKVRITVMVGYGGVVNGGKIYDGPGGMVGVSLPVFELLRLMFGG